MTARDFVYWLQGYFEIRDVQVAGNEGLSPHQTDMIKRHLALVFKHEIDPSQGDAKHQAKLQSIHDGSAAGLHIPFSSEPLIRC